MLSWYILTSNIHDHFVPSSQKHIVRGPGTHTKGYRLTDMSLVWIHFGTLWEHMIVGVEYVQVIVDRLHELFA